MGRSCSPRHREATSAISESRDAANADMARTKWLELEVQREGMRGDALQNKLAAMQLQSQDMNSRVDDLQAALNRQKEQRTAAEQANSRLQGQVAAQQAELDRRQQELEHAMKLWRQEVVSATSSKASATAAWDRFEELARQLMVLVGRAAAAVEELDRGLHAGPHQPCHCCKTGLPQAMSVMHGLLALRDSILQDTTAPKAPSKGSSGTAPAPAPTPAPGPAHELRLSSTAVHTAYPSPGGVAERAATKQFLSSPGVNMATLQPAHDTRNRLTSQQSSAAGATTAAYNWPWTAASCPTSPRVNFPNPPVTNSSGLNSPRLSPAATSAWQQHQQPSWSSGSQPSPSGGSSSQRGPAIQASAMLGRPYTTPQPHASDRMPLVEPQTKAAIGTLQQPPRPRSWEQVQSPGQLQVAGGAYTSCSRLHSPRPCCQGRYHSPQKQDWSIRTG